jgi:hypothetical protein
MWRKEYAVNNSVKRCPKCLKYLPPTEFHNDRFHKDGLRSRCKTCTNATGRAWRKANPQKVRECDRNWYKANPQKKREHNDKWFANHPEKRSEMDKRYRTKHKEVVNQRIRQWSKRNPERRLAAKQRRRGREQQLPSTFTSTDWLRALIYFNNCCAVCGRPVGLWHTLAADHWIPLSDPRPDNPGTVPENIVPLCHGIDGCNNSKFDNDPLEWLNQRLGKRKATAILQWIAAYFEWIRSQTQHIDP